MQRSRDHSQSTERPLRVIVWHVDTVDVPPEGGAGIDARAIRGDGPGEVSAETVTADVAKDATTLSEGPGLPVRQIDADHDIDPWIR